MPLSHRLGDPPHPGAHGSLISAWASDGALQKTRSVSVPSGGNRRPLELSGQSAPLPSWAPATHGWTGTGGDQPASAHPSTSGISGSRWVTLDYSVHPTGPATLYCGEQSLSGMMMGSSPAGHALNSRRGQPHAAAGQAATRRHQAPACSPGSSALMRARQAGGRQLPASSEADFRGCWSILGNSLASQDL